MQRFGRFGGEVLKERGWWVVGQSHLWNIYDQKIQNLHFFLLIPIRMSCHQLLVYIESLFSAVWGWVGITIRTIVSRQWASEIPKVSCSSLLPKLWNNNYPLHFKDVNDANFQGYHQVHSTNCVWRKSKLPYRMKSSWRSWQTPFFWIGRNPEKLDNGVSVVQIVITALYQ